MRTASRQTLTTFPENLEMSWNLTAVRGIKILSGQLLIACFMLGATSVCCLLLFSGLFRLYTAVLKVLSLCEINFKHFAVTFY